MPETIVFAARGTMGEPLVTRFTPDQPSRIQTTPGKTSSVTRALASNWPMDARGAAYKQRSRIYDALKDNHPVGLSFAHALGYDFQQGKAR
jgi:hypothetical protein